MSGEDWCTIESDPGVFTELLEKIGCQQVELEELWSLDDDSLANLGTVHGLIFLFQWIGENQKAHAVDKEPLSEDQIPEGLFFAHQVTTNACATQAILSVILNSQLDNDALGSTLAEFKSFTKDFPPNLKGVAISSSEEIKTAHNAFGRQDAFLNEGRFHLPSSDDEAFHFVAYVPHGSSVYELDGLQSGPMVVGQVEDGHWLSVAREAIQERMAGGGDHIKFNLMAVIEDKRVALQAKLEATDHSSSEHADLVAALAAEAAKREQWQKENQRRRHNYVPLCMAVLQELAAKGTLGELVTAAKERQQAKRAATAAKKASNGGN